MTGTRIGRSLTLAAIALGALAFAAPALAQPTGQIKGTVVDAQNKPVEDARVTIQQDGGQNRKYEVKTNRSGEYMQIGIQPGTYLVQADKGKLSQGFTVRVGPADMKEINFVLKPEAGTSKEEAEKKVAGLQAKFRQAAELSEQGKYDDAIALYNEVLVDVPKCFECFINMGGVHSRKKDWAAAEEAYKKAIEVKGDGPEAYNGLANVYNAQAKFKEAAEMSAEAGKRMATVPGGGASASILYNQGAIAWNANDFAKAKEHFEAAIQADPNYAEAHFMLGKVNLNLGQLKEAVASFQTYVKIAPNAQNAKEAQTFIEQLKGIVK
jgi:tetratricopeptide (TPR) repeat protein